MMVLNIQKTLLFLFLICFVYATNDLNIQGPPGTIFYGTEVKLKCTYNFDEISSVRWSRGNNVVIYEYHPQDEQRCKVYSQSGLNFEVVQGKTSTEIIFNDFNLLSEGEYTCQVTSNNGPSRITKTLRGTSDVEKKPVYVDVPKIAKKGDTIEFTCNYVSFDELYSIKWYQGSREIFRYTPKEVPKIRTFPVRGVDVDATQSNDHKLVLKNVGSDTSGRYTCEVNNDAPTIKTDSDSKNFAVLYLPNGDPTVFVDNDYPAVGEYIEARCSSPPSYPQAKITWMLNGEIIRRGKVNNLREMPGVQVPATSDLGLRINDDTFEGKKANLTCISEIEDAYRAEKTIELEQNFGHTVAGGHHWEHAEGRSSSNPMISGSIIAISFGILVKNYYQR